MGGDLNIWTPTGQMGEAHLSKLPRERHILRGSPTLPQGARERRRRIKGILFGTIPFDQMGLDPLGELDLARKNALVGLGQR